jgi:hypothetical protein
MPFAFADGFLYVKKWDLDPMRFGECEAKKPMEYGRYPTLSAKLIAPVRVFL